MVKVKEKEDEVKAKNVVEKKENWALQVWLDDITVERKKIGT